LSDSKKIKKNYKLLGTENDPVIIAQRLLNLYRQLHIFSAEKKEAYNQMLMEQTPEVKRTLGALPGGVVVQQYLADIEEEAGVDVESFEAEASVEEYETSGGNNHYVHPTAVTVASDPEMVKGIVDAFKEAIVTSEKNRKEDTKELAQTIVALQSKLTQTLLDKKGISTVSYGEGASPQLDEIISGISKAQGELIKEMAQAQTQELSQLISGVLKEIQKMSAQTFISALQAVNGDGLEVFKNNLAGGVSMAPMQQNFQDSRAYHHNDTFSSIENTQTPTFNNLNSYDDIANISPVDLDNQDDAYSFSDTFNEMETSQDEEDNNIKPTETVDTALSEDSYEATSSNEYEWEYVDETEGNVSDEEYEYVDATAVENSDEYEWEYVDETEGNVSDEEYEYVDATAVENSDEYEWEYVDETEGNTSDEGSQIYDEEQYTDPYNPRIDTYQNQQSDNPFAENNGNITFNNNSTDEESISLGDDFGLSLDDDTMALSS